MLQIQGEGDKCWGELQNGLPFPTSKLPKKTASNGTILQIFWDRKGPVYDITWAIHVGSLWKHVHDSWKAFGWDLDSTSFYNIVGHHSITSGISDPGISDIFPLQILFSIPKRFKKSKLSAFLMCLVQARPYLIRFNHQPKNTEASSEFYVDSSWLAHRTTSNIPWSFPSAKEHIGRLANARAAFLS